MPQFKTLLLWSTIEHIQIHSLLYHLLELKYFSFVSFDAMIITSAMLIGTWHTYVYL